MKRKCLGLAITAVCSIASAALYAADFDSSRQLICATFDAHGCDPGVVCERALPSEFGAPQFLRIDFANKTVAGPRRVTPIRFMDNGQSQILMQGTELGYAWTIVLDKDDGSLTVTLVNRDDVLVLFGACTPL
ncbi:hypothetical protein P3T43_000545 [Paraburkholderia sp. GAS41]|jgi:hypothetical protein|uniref:hypothetical protein n=1 Tax=Paraburkholderia sp. GAS41 TaxID=3035134 RepID=UPI003D19B31A